MKVILLQDIENLGKKFDVKEAKNGYARNFLIPRGLVKPATREAVEQLEIQKELEEKKAEEELKNIQELASKVDGIEVVIPVKLGEKEQFFEKINVQKISEKLKELGFEIKKNQIELVNPIEELGEFPVKIKFSHNLEGEIRIIVTEEEKK
jgi:large subunit ribosomal protein L9